MGAHFPSDVVAGFTLGVVFTWLYARSFARKRLLFEFSSSGRLRLRDLGAKRARRKVRRKRNAKCIARTNIRTKACGKSVSILIFDSGIGGLTVLREARVLMPDRQFIYVADNEAFPYGDWKESKLLSHMLKLFGDLIDKWSPELIIIACNTASTLAIHALARTFS